VGDPGSVHEGQWGTRALLMRVSGGPGSVGDPALLMRVSGGPGSAHEGQWGTGLSGGPGSAHEGQWGTGLCSGPDRTSEFTSYCGGAESDLRAIWAGVFRCLFATAASRGSWSTLGSPAEAHGRSPLPRGP